MPRASNPEVKDAFVEFSDDGTDARCAKVRCVHCGFVRAKNTTRQIEHLQECTAYQQSPEGQRAMNTPGSDNPRTTQADSSTPSRPGIYTGQNPNPNLIVQRRGPNKRNRDGADKNNTPSRPVMAPPIAPARPVEQPSLTKHLLSRDPTAFTNATQQPFLSHAGLGTLSSGALRQWLTQDSHYSRGYISFVGALISKIRLPAVPNTQFHPLYRAMDLLISALNNVRREMSFFEITATKYNLNLTGETPNPITRSYLDLLVSASSPAASLLEGLCYRTSWTYASTFTASIHQPLIPHFASSDQHIAALHHSLIPNWTSPAFAKFVDACRAVVDELANAQTSGNGREEMQRCEGAWRQVLYLWEQSWPDVDGMGEEDETARFAGRGRSHTQSAGAAARGDGTTNGDHADNESVTEIRRDGNTGPNDYVSPYGGTGLQAVEAANAAVKDFPG